MADDWKPGDLALCVRTANFFKARRGFLKRLLGAWREHGRGPRNGSYHVVVGLADVGVDAPREAFPMLMFAPWPNESWDHRAFRKVRANEVDAEDHETIRLLTGKPVKEPAA